VTASAVPIAAVITAAGASNRMGGIKKEYRPLGADYRDAEGTALTVLGAALAAFAACPRVSLLVVTVPPDAETGEAAARAALPSYLLRTPTKKPVLFVPGGASRRASVHHALALLASYDVAYVLIHDGARPYIRPDLIDRTIDAVLTHRAVLPVLPLVDTPKELDPAGRVLRHLRRAAIAAAQTPQAFAFPEILQAHEKAAERELREGYEFTDDAEVWGTYVGAVQTIPGSPENRKITFPEDLA